MLAFLLTMQYAGADSHNVSHISQKILVASFLLNENILFYYSSHFEFLQRAAVLALQAIATAIPSVCLSVRPSVTRRYCVKTTARSTVQFAVSDSKMRLVL